MFDPIVLALRLRRDAEATCLPVYADAMRRAAEELEAFARLSDPARISANSAPAG